MLGTLKLPSPAWGGRRGRKDSREKLLPCSFREGVGNRLGSVPSHKFPVGTTRRRTHYYHKSQSPVSSLSDMLKLTLEEAWAQLAQLCSSPS